MKYTNQNNLLLRYMSLAPCALAFERYCECEIYQKQKLAKPVLDLGCGEGLFAHVLFEEKIDTGIDLNKRELCRARELCAYDELIQCSGNSIPKPSEYFQTIFSNSVFEHIPDMVPVFKEVSRLLASDGRFYLTVPSREFENYTFGNQILSALRLKSLAARYRKFISTLIWKQVHYKTLAEWKTFAMEQGFEVEEGFTYDPKTVCLLNNFLYPFSIIAFVTKRIFNRWFLFPQIRQIYIYPLYILVQKILKGSGFAKNGGLVFLSLKKVSPP